MPDRESIRRRLLGFLEHETGEPHESLDDATNLRDGLGLDSVDVVGIVMQIEREYRIRLATEELAGIATAGDLLDLIEAKLAAGPAPAPTPPEPSDSPTSEAPAGG